jgi:hypothetical protein
MQDGFLAKMMSVSVHSQLINFKPLNDIINGIVNLKDWVRYNKDNYRRSIVESVIMTFQKELLDMNLADLFQK